MLEYADYVTRLRSHHPTLTEQISNFVTLEHVLNWMQREGHSYSSLDMVTQDEYCHDLLLPLANNDWLVFGMT
jgi:hypothetical protein